MLTGAEAGIVLHEDESRIVAVALVGVRR